MIWVNDAALANGRVMDMIVVPRISASQNVAGIVPCYSHDTSCDGLDPLSSSEARIHDVSLSVPAYPVQWTRYSSLHLLRQ